MSDEVLYAMSRFFENPQISVFYAEDKVLQSLRADLQRAKEQYQRLEMQYITLSQKYIALCDELRERKA